jgi:hypothetical protein
MRVYRASLLGAAALIAGPCIGTALALVNAHRCGMHPLDRLGCYYIRALDAAWERRAQPF